MGKYEGKTVFLVPNHHVESCGEPTTVIADDPKVYYGYFQNEHGGQMVFTRNLKTGAAILRMGDTNWSEKYLVRNGQVPKLILSPEEQLWLAICWMTSEPICSWNKKKEKEK